MGNLIGEGYKIDAAPLKDGGGPAHRVVIQDDYGTNIEPKKVVNIVLVEQFYPTTVGIFQRMTEEQKAEFYDLTAIDQYDVDEYVEGINADGIIGEFEPGKTCVGSLAEGEGPPQELLNKLSKLQKEVLDGIEEENKADDD